MTYSEKNFQTKKALKEAIAEGQKIGIVEPGPFGSAKENGAVYLEGPHSPQPHKWYAQAIVKDGIIVSVK